MSLMEVVVSFFIDERGYSRKKAVVTLSMGAWSGIIIFGMNIFDIFDYVASYICLPLGGMFVSIFVGWFWGKDKAYNEVTNQGTIQFKLFNAWFFLCKWVIPVIIFLIFLSGIGVI